jgi:hypothetical protein
MTKITGTIKNARHEKRPYDGNPCIRGEVFGHDKFEDGTWIYTSELVDAIEVNLFKTSSGSVYRVEFSNDSARLDPGPG